MWCQIAEKIFYNVEAGQARNNEVLNMKKEGGILSNVYIWVSVIVTVGDFIGYFSNNIYVRIGASAVLVCFSIGSLEIKNRKLQCLREQKARKMKRLDKEITNIKKAMLNKDISEIERDEIQEEEVNLLNEKTETEDRYCRKETEIKHENKKRIHTCGIAFLILSVLNVVAPLIYPSQKEMTSMSQGEAEQGVYGGRDNEICEKLQKEDKLADGPEGKDEIDLQEEYDESKESESKGNIVYGMSFYLDDPTLESIPTPEMIEAVFYVNEDNRNRQAIVNQHMQNLLDQNLKDTYNGCLSPAEERLADEASTQETDFDDSRKLVRQYAAENNYAGWREKLRHSTDLDEIIEKRLRLWKSKKRNGTIASLLANNYQDYALEYQNQNKSGYTILSYYMEAIIWSELVLSYEGTDKEEVFKYLKARYWDIATCQAIPEKYRNHAEAIYCEMGQYEDYIK